ncbi:MAG: hypothetical protein KDB21_10685, partial [Acidimicrobiales bacterium]|nr:hypothetical protein [Acidimicrobiales bacterium]
ACVAVLTLRQGLWERVAPAERGTLDCDPANLVTLVDTAELTTRVEAAAADAEPATPDDGGG